MKMIALEKAQHNHRIKIKDKHLFIHPNQEAVPESYNKGLVKDTTV